MPISSRSDQYKKVLGDWTIRERIGKGAEGKTEVFLIVRTDDGWEENCALKAIPLISEQGSFESLPEHRKKEYQQALAARKTYARNEVQHMAKLRGRTNIVDYLDYSVANWDDGEEFGCDFLIRMELLHDLNKDIRHNRIFNEDEIIHIGIDICNALEICHSKDILHRDIKPGNILYNNDGDYKLGDFGISRILEVCPGSTASTGIGTPEYAAPEQSSGKYDLRVDIYSLGLVLYELSNKNRLPFAESTYLTGSEVQIRLSGRPLPMPSDASTQLATVILKACAFKPEDRFQTAKEFMEALRAIFSNAPNAAVSTQKVVTEEVVSKPAASGYDTVPAMPAEVPVKRSAYATMPAMGQKAPALVVTDANENIEDQDDVLVKALSGDAEAQYEMGERYLEGRNGVTQNYEEAAKWYEKAANSGNVEAMIKLGQCYSRGDGVTRSDEEAVKWYKKAADGGSTTAMLKLGWCYRWGDGVTRSDEEAVKWYKKAVDGGNVDAMDTLGYCYCWGNGVTQSNEEAVKWYQKAADGGNVNAMRILGERYSKGDGVIQSDEEAVKWYKKAADGGNIEAMIKLGEHCRHGWGVTRSDEEMVKWYEKAADSGDVRTMVKLGDYYQYDCYIYGDCIAPNYEEAAKWYEKAANEYLEYKFAAVFREEASALQEKAAVLYEKAAKEGSAYGAYCAGNCYENGIGVDKDISKALVYYSMAIKRGYSDATPRFDELISKASKFDKIKYGIKNKRRT